MSACGGEEEEEQTDGPNWPRPVQMVKDDSKKILLMMSVPEMDLVRAKLVGPLQPGKTVTTTCQASEGELTLRYDVGLKDGNTKTYEYHKKMPEDINPNKTLNSLQYKRGPKGALVEVTLWKAVPASWNEHIRYLTTRNK